MRNSEKRKGKNRTNKLHCYFIRFFFLAKVKKFSAKCNLFALNVRRFRVGLIDSRPPHCFSSSNYIRARAMRSGTRDEDPRLERPTRCFPGRTPTNAERARRELLTMQNNASLACIEFSETSGSEVLHCPEFSGKFVMRIRARARDPRS